MSSSPPCVLFEDEHLLVVNKPPGLNTHAPAPHAGEGLYEHLKHREPRWASLALVHRLDKATSGLIVFTKTSLASRSLTQQFTERAVHKKYLLLTDRLSLTGECVVRSKLVRLGERYVSRPDSPGPQAETRFRVADGSSAATTVEAEPLTGRTHQIRVHAADQGWPILGDTLYGGSPFHRLCLHSAELRFRHPATGEQLTFTSNPDFHLNAQTTLRDSLIEPESTNAYRLVHGGADGCPGWYLDRLGGFLLSASDAQDRPAAPSAAALDLWLQRYRPAGVYHKQLTRSPGAAAASPQLVHGSAAPETFVVRENGLAFELSFGEGYSIGLFLDQRDNRRRVLINHIAAGFPLFEQVEAPEVLNTFAYTCAFSVCAARAGARTTSLDLSKKYLAWGQRNFELNQIDPSTHDFLFGDVFDWLARLRRKKRAFDLVILDPPTFSRSKQHGTFRAETDYGQLVAQALPLIKPGGVLFASTNAATLKPETFRRSLRDVIQASGRRIVLEHYATQPPDFPISSEYPGYLKTVWMRLGASPL